MSYDVEIDIFLEIWEAIENSIPAAKRSDSALKYIMRIRENIEDVDFSPIIGENDLLDEAIENTSDVESAYVHDVA